MENIIFSEALTPAEITQIIVSQYANSEAINEMLTADNYFEGQDEEISKKTRSYFDKDRKEIENPAAHNSQIKSNFLRMLVQQHQNYAFAKTFVFKIYDEDKKEIDLKKDEYCKEWQKFLDDILYKLVYQLSGNAINHGIGWVYVWVDEDGSLKLKEAGADLIYPVWKDEEHTVLDRLVYHYTVQVYNNLSPTRNDYAEYWDSKERRLFKINDGYKEENPDENHNHLSNGDEEQSWGRVPFVYLKATDDEKTLLSFIKEQIDAYNMLASKSVDGLIDDLDPLLVLKGISPAVGDLIEARELARMTRTIATDTDGDAGYIQAQTPIDNHIKEMQALRRDIIKFGYGVDYEDGRFGGNPNQLLIKSLYQDLDTYTDGLERHFQNFIDDLKYFFDKWWEFSRKGSFEECQKYTVLISLDRSMMLNLSSQIDDTVKLMNTGVSQRTLLEFNPVVQEVDMELERLEEEKKKAAENEELFNFGDAENKE